MVPAYECRTVSDDNEPVSVWRGHRCADRDPAAWRVLEVATGERIGRLELPAGVHGGPITCSLRPGSRQFIVVAAGGRDALGSPKGDYVIAWSLPRSTQPWQAHGP